MDPKPQIFKSPDTSSNDPSFGAKLVGWVKTDMERAKKARDDAKAKADAKARANTKSERSG